MNINLRGFLSVLSSTKAVRINLFDEATKLLIISFDQPGYSALEDSLEESEITKIEVLNTTAMNVYISR